MLFLESLLHIVSEETSRGSHLVTWPPLSASGPREGEQCVGAILSKGKRQPERSEGFAEGRGPTEGPHGSRGAHKQEPNLPWEGTGLARQPRRTEAASVFCEALR